MINSQITIGGHLTKRILCDERGAEVTLPTLYPNLYQFRLKLFDVGPDGAIRLAYPDVTSLTSSIGLVYAEPRAGTFQLRYGTGPTTADIDCRESAQDLKTKLMVLPLSTTYGLQEVYQAAASTWMFHFATPPPSPTLVDLNGYNNQLDPETFIRSRQFVQNNETWVEIALLQGPIASSLLFDHILTSAPTVVEIRAGQTIYDPLGNAILIDEIQSVIVPSDFTGTFALKFQGRQTGTFFSVTSSTGDIQDALNAMYGDNVARFVVTNPIPENAYIEFVGPFAGQAQPLLEIVLGDTGPQDLTFNLDLNTAEVAEAIRRSPNVAATFEIKLHIVDPTVPMDPGQDLILFQSPVNVDRPLQWDGLQDAPPINWLFPPNPKDFIPFDINQVITGDQSYTTPFGDGITNVYTISHMLNSDALGVSVRQNIDPGNLLNDGQYTVQFTNTNALQITILGGPPAINSLIITVFAHGPISAFLNHTHTIGQIIGLQDILDNILFRLSTLEALLPSLVQGIVVGNTTFGSAPTNLAGFTIDDRWSIVPTNWLPDKFDPKNPGTTLPPAGMLLPAVHDVIELGNFVATVDPASLITLVTDHPGLVDGQRARIDTPTYQLVGSCTFNETLLLVVGTNALVSGQQVMFKGTGLPPGISILIAYYVINPTTANFQIALTKGGSPVDFLGPATVPDSTFYSLAEIPSPLQAGVDYFMLAPTAGPTTFKLSATIDGPYIPITDTGVPPFTISTIPDAPVPLPGVGVGKGNAYSVRNIIQLPAQVGIPSETLVPGDIIASDGRVWYHVTRSDVPGSNSFYPNAMEREIFRLHVNENMMKPGSTFTLTFNIVLQMFKQDCNVQYLLVTEIADTPGVLVPAPTGPNLFEVEWNVTPLMQQRIIITDVPTSHDFGAQVIRNIHGALLSNKKQYGVVLPGDVVPLNPAFAMRVRLIEFDTEDNQPDAWGLIYYTVTKISAGVTVGIGVQPPATTTP